MLGLGFRFGLNLGLEIVLELGFAFRVGLFLGLWLG